MLDDAIEDWDSHLHKLIAFWSSVMLTSGRYKGNPVAAHMKHLEAITPPMFDRWLALWAEVTEEILPAQVAESLKLALYFRLPPAPGSPPASATAAS